MYPKDNIPTEDVPLNQPIWTNEESERKWVTLKPLTRNAKCDICVIGLGASGLSAINQLVKGGYAVIGIDAEDCASGAAGRNGGFLLAGFDEEYHDNVTRLGRERTRQIYLETVEELNSMFREYPECTSQVGSLRLAPDEKSRDELLK